MTQTTRNYTFTAGPDSDPYTVETPWTPEGVALAIQYLEMTREAVHGAMIMILSPQYDSLADCMIMPTQAEAPAEFVTLAGIKASLDSWTQFDKGEQAWEDRYMSQEPWLD